MGVGQAGLITPGVWVVLVTHSGGGHLLAMTLGILGGRGLLQRGLSLHVLQKRCLQNSLGCQRVMFSFIFIYKDLIGGRTNRESSSLVIDKVD